MSTRAKSATRVVVSLLCMLMLGACASSIVVTGSIPTPLIAKLPLAAELSYSDEFRRYNYEEKEKGRALKNLQFGQAQTSMFDGVFRHILTVVESPLSSGQAIDLRISPELLDFQYSVPRETSLNLYEVWLKYRVKITDPVDATIADWVVKGYGKTPTATLSSAATAFNAATNVALRDVGAQLAIGFVRQDAISQMLQAKATGVGTASDIVDSEPLADLVDSAPTADIVDSAPTADLVDSAPTADIVDSAPTADIVDSAPTADIVDSAPTAEEQEVN